MTTGTGTAAQLEQLQDTVNQLTERLDKVEKGQKTIVWMRYRVLELLKDAGLYSETDTRAA
jgi:uncharacterized protein YdaL